MKLEPGEKELLRSAIEEKYRDGNNGAIPDFVTNAESEVYKWLKLEIQRKIDSEHDVCFNQCQYKQRCEEERQKRKPNTEHFCQKEDIKNFDVKLGASTRQLVGLLCDETSSSSKDAFYEGFINSVYLYIGKQRDFSQKESIKKLPEEQVTELAGGKEEGGNIIAIDDPKIVINTPNQPEYREVLADNSSTAHGDGLRMRDLFSIIKDTPASLKRIIGIGSLIVVTVLGIYYYLHKQDLDRPVWEEKVIEIKDIGENTINYFSFIKTIFTGNIWTLIIFILVFFVTVFQSAKIPKNHEYGRKSILQVILWGGGVMFSWLFLYIWLSYSIKDYQVSYFENAVADIINNMNGFAFIGLFLIMDIKSIASKEQPKRNADFITAFICIFVISVFVSLVSCWDYFYRLPSLYNQFVQEGDASLKNSIKIGSFVSACFNAVSMMYFFGKLDSRFFGANRFTLAVFYLYASIQVSWVFLLGNEEYNFLFIGAIVLKIIVILSIFNWLRNGNFADYFVSWNKNFG